MARGAGNADRADGRQRATQAVGPPGHGAALSLEVKNLRQALESKEARAEAAEHLRALIGKVVLTREPGRDDLRIDLHGDLAGILSIASQKRVRPGKTPNWSASGPNTMALVAGEDLVIA